jgi:hypothetical protein
VTTDNTWVEPLIDELSEEYDIPANSMGKHVQYVEVELPATRHVLEICHHSLYGFMVNLRISDETGGILKDMTVYTAVYQERLASLIDDFYRSY